MKIKVIEKITLGVARQTYTEISKILAKGKKYTCKIDGKPYYLAQMSSQNSGWFVEATFVSIDPVEIEVTDDV